MSNDSAEKKSDFDLNDEISLQRIAGLRRVHLERIAVYSMYSMLPATLACVTCYFVNAHPERLNGIQWLLGVICVPFALLNTATSIYPIPGSIALLLSIEGWIPRVIASLYVAFTFITGGFFVVVITLDISELSGIRYAGMIYGKVLAGVLLITVVAYFVHFIREWREERGPFLEWFAKEGSWTWEYDD